MDASTVTLPIAFAAGLLSFVSPCVLPLVPGYLGYLAGQAVGTLGGGMAAATPEGGTVQVAAPAPRWIIVLHSLFFMLGFTVIFVLLGISVGALGQLQRLMLRNLDVINWVGGGLVIVFGLHTIGLIRIPFLYYDTRKQTSPRPELGYFGSFLMGVTFSAGWSPCIGVFLGTILTLGATVGSTGQAAWLLVAYALGLGLPFLLVAIFLERSTGPLRKLQKHMRTIEIVSGVILLIVGVLIFTGMLQRYSGLLAGQTVELSIALDNWLLSLVNGGR